MPPTHSDIATITSTDVAETQVRNYTDKKPSCRCARIADRTALVQTI